MEQPEVSPSRQSSLDPVSIHDSSSLKKPRGGKPKLFQCTGYGECRMVFTRSEHLARHMRKHTGEKPFKCVVPECNRMFSRFDNMMQHTQTHNKARSTSRGPKNGSTGKSKGKRSSEASLSDEDSCYDQSGLPSPPPSRRGTKNKDLYRARIRQQRQLQRKNYAEDYEEEDRDDDDDDDDDEDDDDDMEGLGYGDSDESDSDASYSMYGYHHNSAIADQREMFAEMRRSSHDGYTLPLPVPYSQQHPSLPWPAMPKSVLNHDPIWSLPSIHAPIPLIPSGSRTSQRPHRRHRLSESPLSFSSGSTTDASPCKRQRTTPKVQFHPYPYNGSSHRRHSTDNGQTLRPLYHPKKSGDRSTPIDEDDRHMILPRIATYLVAHPDEPPENYLLHHQQRSPLYQKRAMTWPTLPGTEKVITRRLSVQDLCNPIECLEHSDGNMALPTPVKQEEEDGVDLTLDEYEAIQGFGRFQKCGLLGLE